MWEETIQIQGFVAGSSAEALLSWKAPASFSVASGLAWLTHAPYATVTERSTAVFTEHRKTNTI